MKKLFLLLTIFSFPFSTKTMHSIRYLPQRCKAFITGELPGDPADEKTTQQVRELLTVLKHKNPDSVPVRFYNETFNIPGTSGLYDPFLNTIFLKKYSNTFTKAHEATHATFDTTWSMRMAYYVITNMATVAMFDKLKVSQRNKIIGTSLFMMGSFIKGVSQPRELRADIEGAKALLALNDKGAVERELLCLRQGNYISRKSNANNNKLLKFIEKQRSGFYFDGDTQLDLSKGTSEKFLTNWKMHPTHGKRYFTIKALLDEHNKNEK